MSPDGAMWTFEYDHNGLRTEREYSYYGEVVLNTKYTWVDEKLVREYRSGGMNATPITIEYFYDGEELIGFTYNGENYYYGKTNNGEIRFIYDGNGNIVTTYLYDAWGAPISISGSLASTVGEINPFRYKSYYYDSETRLYYLRSRSYDPAVGRFLNADAVEYLGATGTLLSYNLFAYCENNAVNLFDANGQLSFLSTFAKIVLSIAIGVFSQVFFDLIMRLADKNYKSKVTDYIASIASSFSIFFTSQKKWIDWLVTAIPWVTKLVGGLFSKPDWNTIIIEIGFWVATNVISIVLKKSQQSKIRNIARKFKNNQAAVQKIAKSTLNLEIKYQVLGLKFNFSLFFSNSSLQTFVSIIKNYMEKLA